MDLALKQRLVGATVLVALGVIFIPMLLDGPADRTAHDPGARIPEPPADQVQTRRLPLRPQAQSEPRSQDAGAAVDESGAAIPEVVISELPREPQETAQRPSGTGDDSPSRTDGWDVPGTQPPSVDESVPAAQPPAGGRWLLQLGVFADESNATALVSALSEAGFPAFRDRLAGGDRVLHRVGVGHWSDRESAADAGSQIARVFPDAEISLKRSDGGAASSGSGDAGVGWMVQVGSFAREENAAALRDRLREAGFAAHSDRLKVDDRIRYRVRVGPELERADAEAVQQRLKQEMDINGLVVSHP